MYDAINRIAAEPTPEPIDEDSEYEQYYTVPEWPSSASSPVAGSSPVAVSSLVSVSSPVAVSSRLRRPSPRLVKRPPTIPQLDPYEIPDNEEEELETVPSTPSRGSGRPTRAKVAARRPTAGDSYYSTSREVRSEALWAAGSAKRRALLSHVGRIEETDAGVSRNLACARCVEKGFVCSVYSAAAVEEFAGKKGSSNACARCRYSGKQCLD